MNTWVKGKDGWYMARIGWADSYAEHLRSLGYEVEKAHKAPGAA